MKCKYQIQSLDADGYHRQSDEADTLKVAKSRCHALLEEDPQANYALVRDAAGECVYDAYGSADR